MKLHNLVLLFLVLILVYFEQTTRIEARRRSSNVQRGDKKLIRAGDFRLIKPKMNKRKLEKFVVSLSTNQSVISSVDELRKD